MGLNRVVLCGTSTQAALTLNSRQQFRTHPQGSPRPSRSSKPTKECLKRLINMKTLRRGQMERAEQRAPRVLFRMLTLSRQTFSARQRRAAQRESTSVVVGGVDVSTSRSDVDGSAAGAVEWPRSCACTPLVAIPAAAATANNNFMMTLLYTYLL